MQCRWSERVTIASMVKVKRGSRVGKVDAPKNRRTKGKIR
jgi:hypothetical protein